MYTTTFYSFKGGVGRSMALVNAGVELARRNRRVLLVDFDLTAPSLATFDALKTHKPKAGLVDLVNDYLINGSVPDLQNYVLQCRNSANCDGDIWLMPAGSVASTYERNYHQLDWVDLYENHEGFLLFEDLKQQWKDSLAPDYVLIDCSSGFTDIGSICTRQLPDAVTILFSPNEQSLEGVVRIVKEIQTEKNGPRQKDIQLHFVVSNVPDLDDEHQILERNINQFKESLELDEDLLFIHRYDSLSLLNQEVFTQERPNTRLAVEYRKIVDSLIAGNSHDRDDHEVAQTVQG